MYELYERIQVTIAQILDAAQRSLVASYYNAITLMAIPQKINISRGAICDDFNSEVSMFSPMRMRRLQVTRFMLYQAKPIADGISETHLMINHEAFPDSVEALNR